MRTTLSRNAMIGIVFIASLVMIYFGVNFLKGMNVLKKKNIYTAVFEDVTSLTVSSPVYVNGYQIGLVNSIDMINDNPIRFAVKINLEENFRFTKGSRLEFGIDLFNQSIVKLLVNDQSTEYLTPGDTIYGGREVGMMDGVMKVMPRADSILMNIDSITLSLHALMANPMWEKSITGIGTTIELLNSSSRDLSAMMSSIKTDLPELTNNMTSVSGNLKEITDELNAMDLTKTFATIDETVDNLKILSDKLNNDESSIGKMMNNPHLHDSLTKALNMTARLLEDIRTDPKRYLSVKVRLF